MKKPTKENIAKEDEIDLVEIINILLSHWKLILLGSITPMILYLGLNLLFKSSHDSLNMYYQTPELSAGEFEQLKVFLGSSSKINANEIDTVPSYDSKNQTDVYSVIKISLDTKKSKNYHELKSDLDENQISPVLGEFGRNNLVNRYIQEINKSQYQTTDQIKFNNDINLMRETLKEYRKLRLKIGGGHNVEIPSKLIQNNYSSTPVNTVNDVPTGIQKEQSYYYLSLDQQIMALETMLVDKTVLLSAIEKQEKSKQYLLRHLNQLLVLNSVDKSIDYMKKMKIPDSSRGLETDYKLLKEIILDELPSAGEGYILKNYNVTKTANGILKNSIILLFASGFLMVLTAFILEFISKNRSRFKREV
jgi:hypothetical protein